MKAKNINLYKNFPGNNFAHSLHFMAGPGWGFGAHRLAEMQLLEPVQRVHLGRLPQLLRLLRAPRPGGAVLRGLRRAHLQELLQVPGCTHARTAHTGIVCSPPTHHEPGRRCWLRCKAALLPPPGGGGGDPGGRAAPQLKSLLAETAAFADSW